MIEVHESYDLMPGADWLKFQDWAKRAIDVVLRAPGLIEFRTFRNVSGSPFVGPVTKWQSLADWARLMESAEWKAIWSEAQIKLITNIRTEIWEPSPIYPDPLYPKK